MSFDQAAILVLLFGMLVVFALDRIRMEIVALSGLGIGLALGLVPPALAFAGFANPAFITVVEVLLIVQVLGRSGLLDALAGRLLSPDASERRALVVLCLVTATISVFMNNIGALALMFPAVASVARVGGFDQRRMLMPVSFAALLGGLCSVIGTPANLLVSQQLERRSGHGFAFFDFAWVGVPVAIAGLLAVVLWVRRALTGEDGQARLRQPCHGSRMVATEATVPSGSPFSGIAPAKFPGKLHGLRRGGENVFFQREGTLIAAGDVLLMETELPLLDEWLANGALTLPPPAGGDRAEAVLMPESTLVGSRVGSLAGLAARGVRVVAVAVRTPRIEGSLDDLRLSIGDILYLEGDREAVDDAIVEAELLPLRPRAPMDPVRKSWLLALVFGAGILGASFGFAPPELAFGLVVLVLAASGALNLRQGLASLDWPILIMLAALIPLGFAVESTGAAAVFADQLTAALPAGEPLLLVAAVLMLTVIITPVVNNASTAIVLGPIAVGIADKAGLPPEPFLIAVALGASIDFLTPIGHHNNTVVMGLAGYRFVDFLKAGWPVTLAAVAAGVGAIGFFWI